jgi:hypothetical protein
MNYVFRSRNRGDDWERISPDLTHNDPSRLGDIQFQTIVALAESPLREGLLYAGTDDGRVHAMRSPTSEWADISAGLHGDRFTSEIVASAYDEATVYVTQNGRRNDDFAPYVWRSTDYGRTWTSIVANIPFGPVNILREDPKNPSILYVGTDVGVYVSLDRGGARCGYPIGLSYPPDWGERTISLRTTDTTILEPGMTFHFMPGLWMDDWGLEITESIVITESGPAECLLDVPRELIVVD